MVLSKKHFIDLAKMVENLPEVVEKERVIRMLVSFCSEYGPNFDKERFKAACEGNW